MIRLLNMYTLQLQEFDDNSTPQYAIASHRWQKDESTFKDVLKGQNKDSLGFAKIRGFCRWLSFGREANPSLYSMFPQWLWIDTCCIDKTSSAELSEAINSMYDWYPEAEFCIAYLSDYELKEEAAEFELSEWFSRGWTLQKLIAPQTVVFLDRDWRTIGHKSGAEQDRTSPQLLHILGNEISPRIASRTGIPEGVIRDDKELDKLSVETRLSWMDKRYTTRTEDQAYCLLGIFNLYMPPIYGERQHAITSLLDEILRKQVRTTGGLNNLHGNSKVSPGDSTDGAGITPKSVLQTMQSLQNRISELESSMAMCSIARTKEEQDDPGKCSELCLSSTTNWNSRQCMRTPQ